MGTILGTAQPKNGAVLNPSTSEKSYFTTVPGIMENKRKRVCSHSDSEGRAFESRRAHQETPCTSRVYAHKEYISLGRLRSHMVAQSFSSFLECTPPE